MKKIKCFSDVFAGGVLLVISAFLYTQTFKIKRMASLSDSVGPRFFPQMILIVMMALAVMLIISGIPKGRRKLLEMAAAPAVEKKKSEGGFFKRVFAVIDTDTRVRAWISILGIFFFILLIKPLGFAISATIYLFIQFSLLAPPGKRRLWLFAIIAVAVGFGAYVLFRYAIRINLPAGILKDIL